MFWFAIQVRGVVHVCELATNPCAVIHGLRVCVSDAQSHLAVYSSYSQPFGICGYYYRRDDVLLYAPNLFDDQRQPNNPV